MALIKCPECGKEISDKAGSCPGCGCPLSEMITSGLVRIKIPNNIVEGGIGLFCSRDAVIYDANYKRLWNGKHGDNARFTIDKPTDIIIDLGSMANEIKGKVCPNRKYSCVQDMGLHWRATYRLTEVDFIDSD